MVRVLSSLVIQPSNSQRMFWMFETPSPAFPSKSPLHKGWGASGSFCILRQTQKCPLGTPVLPRPEDPFANVSATGSSFQVCHMPCHSPRPLRWLAGEAPLVPFSSRKQISDSAAARSIGSRNNRIKKHREVGRIAFISRGSQLFVAWASGTISTWTSGAACLANSANCDWMMSSALGLRYVIIHAVI